MKTFICGTVRASTPIATEIRKKGDQNRRADLDRDHEDVVGENDDLVDDLLLQFHPAQRHHVETVQQSLKYEVVSIDREHDQDRHDVEKLAYDRDLFRSSWGRSH